MLTAQAVNENNTAATGSPPKSLANCPFKTTFGFVTKGAYKLVWHKC
ncbi:hypothetical protein [Acinetobacter guillouiae]